MPGRRPPCHRGRPGLPPRTLPAAGRVVATRPAGASRLRPRAAWAGGASRRKPRLRETLDPVPAARYRRPIPWSVDTRLAEREAAGMFNLLRSSFAPPLAAAIVLAIAAPAAAITNGAPDLTHKNVGALLLSDADGNTVQGCTGTLLAPREMLTAGHCGAIAQDLLDAGVF